jgi:hypothetical protein
MLLEANEHQVLVPEQLGCCCTLGRAGQVQMGFQSLHVNHVCWKCNYVYIRVTYLLAMLR